MGAGVGLGMGEVAVGAEVEASQLVPQWVAAELVVGKSGAGPRSPSERPPQSGEAVGKLEAGALNPVREAARRLGSGSTWAAAPTAAFLRSERRSHN